MQREPDDLWERSQGCRAPGCLTLAECTIDEVAYCLDCADAWLERLKVPHPLRGMMPPVWER